LPIYTSLHNFILAYIHHLNEIVALLEKVMRDLCKNNNDSHIVSLIEIFDTMREKELVNIEEWK
jgi:hypothetical protein